MIATDLRTDEPTTLLNFRATESIWVVRIKGRPEIMTRERTSFAPHLCHGLPQITRPPHVTVTMPKTTKYR